MADLLETSRNKISYCEGYAIYKLIYSVWGLTEVSVIAYVTSR